VRLMLSRRGLDHECLVARGLSESHLVVTTHTETVWGVGGRATHCRSDGYTVQAECSEGTASQHGPDLLGIASEELRVAETLLRVNAGDWARSWVQPSPGAVIAVNLSVHMQPSSTATGSIRERRSRNVRRTSVGMRLSR